MKRVFRIKQASLRFFCPLCSADRGFRYRPVLQSKNYIQIVILILVVALTLWPFWGGKALYLAILVWPGYEFVARMLYRKDIPCPHCGFDAAWYKRDVGKASSMVKKFWHNKGIRS